MDCSPYSEHIHGLQWHLTKSGYGSCTSGLLPVISAFTALAFYTTASLTCQLFWTFKSYKSLYFWSLFVTSWALSIHALGLLMLTIDSFAHWIHWTVLYEFGWVFMTTGFAFVLYSRLYILDLRKRWQYAVLAMIVIIAVLSHTASLTIKYASTRANRVAWLRGGIVMIQIYPWLFMVQEVIISSLYVKAATQYLQPGALARQRNWNRRQILILILIQAGVWMLDSAAIGLALANFFSLLELLYSFVFGFKLKLEFVFLNQLKEISKAVASDGDLFTPQELELQHAPPELVLHVSDDGQEIATAVAPSDTATRLK